MKVSPLTRYGLRAIALIYLFILLIVPVGTIFYRSFEHGIVQFWEWITTPAAISALQLSLLIVVIVVPLNVVFGVLTALALARGRFPGKGVLQAVVDLPFAVSPVVAGVALILLWGYGGWFGGVESLGFRVIFGFPGLYSPPCSSHCRSSRARSSRCCVRSAPNRRRLRQPWEPMRGRCSGGSPCPPSDGA